MQDGELVRVYLSSGASVLVNPGEGRDADWVTQQIAKAPGRRADQ